MDGNTTDPEVCKYSYTPADPNDREDFDATMASIEKLAASDDEDQALRGRALRKLVPAGFHYMDLERLAGSSPADTGLGLVTGTAAMFVGLVSILPQQDGVSDEQSVRAACDALKRMLDLEAERFAAIQDAKPAVGGAAEQLMQGVAEAVKKAAKRAREGKADES